MADADADAGADDDADADHDADADTQDVEKIDNFASHRLMMISISPLGGC